MNLINFLKKLKTVINNIERQQPANSDQQLLLLGKLLSEDIKNKKHIDALREVEFQVFSQFGDDGIIQWLVNNLEFPNKTFVEFGVENYRESNTRFLMMNNNWSGLVMDGSESNVRQIANSEYYWRYELTAPCIICFRAANYWIDLCFITNPFRMLCRISFGFA